MQKNMGGTDRILRVILAIVFATLYLTETVNGTAGMIMGILSIVFLLTSLVSFCPLYVPFGIRTCRKD